MIYIEEAIGMVDNHSLTILLKIRQCDGDCGSGGRVRDVFIWDNKIKKCAKWTTEYDVAPHNETTPITACF